MIVCALLLLICASARAGCDKRRLTPLDRLKERRYEYMVKSRELLTEDVIANLYQLDRVGVWYILQPDYSCADTTLVGSQFYDGGKYLCNMHFIGSARKESDSCLVYSFGVNGEIGFEREFRQLFPDCEMHAFDPTPSVVGGKSAFQLDRYGVKYHPWGLSDVDEAITLESKRVDAYSLDSVIQRLGHQHEIIDILKIDIEGYEWRVFHGLLRHCDREYPVANQIITELHIKSARQYPTGLAGFMDDMRACGYRTFSKDANHFCPSCMEYGFVHESFLLCK